jgi:CBS domain containing-hemolysin-like protein
MIYNILLTLFFVFLNGFFVAAEFAIVKVRTSQLELKIRAGNGIAKIAKSIVGHLDAYLSACQLGITLASLGLGWIGESVVAAIILDVMDLFGFTLSTKTAHSISLPAAFAMITFLHIVFGELAPKSIAIQKPEQISLAVAMPLRIFHFVFKPFIWILNTLANNIIKLFGFEPIYEQELHSSEELKYLIQESSKSGIIEATDKKLLENVFEFADKPIKQIMVPHNKIFAIEIDTPSEKIMEMFIEEGYSRIPVYKNSIDNIVGIIYAKDLISLLANKNLIVIQDIIRPVFFVLEDEKINVLLHKLQKEKMHLAIVLDEFGGTAGIVTLEDVLEEIVGEIQDEYDEELPILEVVSADKFKVLASASINDVNELLPVPLPESQDYETVGGLIMNVTGRIPALNEKIKLSNYICEILKRSERKIEIIGLSLIKKVVSE